MPAVTRSSPCPRRLHGIAYELAGFKKVLREGLTVTAARTLTVDVTLEAGNLAETVTVVGGPPTVDVTNTNIATSIDAQALQTIPTARDVWAILQNLAPQVVLDREDVGGSQGGLQAVFSAFGSTWHQNTYALNGVNVTDPAASGAAGFYYDYDSFQETQVSTAQHSAEIGTPGVYYNIIVKSGTDSFHGGSAYYFENDSMVSDNLSQELRDQGVSIGSSINLFSDWTAQLGGPAHEAAPPVLYELARLANPSRCRRLSGVREHGHVLGPGERHLPIEPEEPHHRPVYPADLLQAQSKRERVQSSRERPGSKTMCSRSTRGRLQLQIGNNAVFDARVSYSTIAFPLNLQPDVTGPNVVELSTGVNSGAASQNFDQWRTRLAIDGGVTIVKRTGRVDPQHQGRLPASSGGFSDSIQDVFQGINLQVFEGEPQRVIEYNSPVGEEEIFRGSVLHVQDNVGFGRVTLNLGLRFEHTEGLLPEQGAPGGPFSSPRSFAEEDVFSWNTLAPRIGVVFDPLPTHKVAVKAGYARYYHAARHRLCLTAQPEQSQWD